MATLLQNLCIGQYQACLLALTRLDSSCAPLTGPNDQVRTTCFASVDAQPQYDDGLEYGRRSTNGKRCFYVRDCNHFKQIDLTIQVITWDFELIELATGSDVLLGDTGTPFVGKTMGFGLPGADESCPSGVAVEVYTKAAYGTGGFCISAASAAPTWVRHLFPFARLSMGQVTLDDSSDGIMLNMTGFSMSNPNWGNGPNNDWPASVDVDPTSPYLAVFTNTKPSSTCGYIDAGQEFIPPPAPFADAVFYIDAVSDNASSITAINLGTGGVALNAQYGSAAGSDTNDPLWLPSAATVGGGYYVCPGVAGNYLSVPDSAALDVAGDLTMVFDLTLWDWTPTVENRLGGKEQSYTCRITTGGLVYFRFGDTAGVGHDVFSSVPVPFTDGNRGQVAMTKVGASSTGDVKFFTRNTDADSWVQLGTTQNGGGTGVFVGTGLTTLGCDTTGGSLSTAKHHRLLVYPSVGASGVPATTGAVLDINCGTNIVNEAVSSFTATTGQTVTVNRSATGRKSVLVSTTGRARWLMGTDDFLVVNDNNLLDFTVSQSFTTMWIRRTWAITGGGFFKRNDSSGIYMMYEDGTGVVNRILCTNNVDVFSYASITPPQGTMYMQTMVRDVGSDVIRNYIGGSAAGTTPDTTTGSLTGTANLYIGQTGGTAPGYFNGEVMMAAVWRRVLTPAEIATIATYYGV